MREECENLWSFEGSTTSYKHFTSFSLELLSSGMSASSSTMPTVDEIDRNKHA